MFKNHLLKAFALFLIIFLFIFMLNYFIDPYGYKSRNGKFVKNLAMFNKPKVSNARLNSNGYYYLVGSSRMSRVNPKLIENLTGKDTHNLKIDGATLPENTFIASKIKEHNKYFIYSFDAFSSNKNRESFKEINNRSEVYKNDLNKNISITKYFNSDITIRSLQHYLKNLRGDELQKQYLEENERKSDFRYDLALNSSGFLNNIDKSNFSNYEAYSNEEIISLAKLGTKNDIFVIFPKYLPYYLFFSNYQDIEKKYFNLIKTLVENTDAQVWSFYGENNITKNEQNFIDNGWHFKPEVSNIIFQDIFNYENKGSTETGFLITRENVSRYLLELSEEVDSIILNEI